MGFLAHIFAALAVHALDEAGFGSGVRAPVALLLLPAMPYFVAWRARRALRAGRFARAARLARTVQHSAPLLHLVAVAGFGWARSVQAWLGDGSSFAGWPGPELALSLAPFVLLELSAIDAVSRIDPGFAADRRAQRRLQTRTFLASLAPIALYLVVAALIASNETLRVQIERVALWHALALSALLALLCLLLPAILRSVWETVPLAPGPVRELFEHIAARARFRAREILLWRTGHQMANAAVVGVTARSRVVLLSDSLLSTLSPRELASVFAHEIGHAARHHVPIFLAWALAFFLAADRIASALASTGPVWIAAVATAAVAAFVLGFGWLSRRFELDADLYALELLGDAEALASALERVGGRLRDVAGWRHFSVNARVAFLRRAAGEPGFARRFRRRVRGLAAVGVLAAAALSAVGLRDLLEAYPTDRVVADLALGRYESAARRAASVKGLDGEIAALVQLGRERVGERASGDELERELAAALDERRLADALGFARLGALRGRDSLLPVVQALEALGREDERAARAAARAAPPGWRSRLEVWTGADGGQ